MRPVTMAIAAAALMVAAGCDEGKGGETDTGTDTAADTTPADTAGDEVVADTAGDPDAMDTAESDVVHDIPTDPANETPHYPSDCAEVSYFQCGFSASCVSGELVVDWHEHVFTDDVEDIVPFHCTHECEFGCAEGYIMDWPPNGAELVADWCFGPSDGEGAEEDVPEESDPEPVPDA